MKIHHLNRAYFALQIVQCYDQQRLVKESKHDLPIDHKISDV